MKRFGLALIALLMSACGSTGVPASDFSVDVSPPEQPVEVRAAIPGQHIPFLVWITDPANDPTRAIVRATTVSASVERIDGSELTPGRVAEVWVTVDPNITVESTASVTITVERGGFAHLVTRTIKVMPVSSEGRDRDAQPHFAFWTHWLEANHPELGITAATKWQPEFVSVLLVVSHMSYYSAEWEMSLSWHAGTIPPYDWSQIYLRKRGSETRPSLAFKLDSFTARTAPYPVTPPEVVVR